MWGFKRYVENVCNAALFRLNSGTITHTACHRVHAARAAKEAFPGVMLCIHIWIPHEILSILSINTWSRNENLSPTTSFHFQGLWCQIGTGPSEHLRIHFFGGGSRAAVGQPPMLERVGQCQGGLEGVEDGWKIWNCYTQGAFQSSSGAQHPWQEGWWRLRGEAGGGGKKFQLLLAC